MIKKLIVGGLVALGIFSTAVADQYILANPLPATAGGTGASTVAGAKTALGIPTVYKATSASISPGALVAGACSATNVTVTGAAAGGTQTVTVTPNTYPGDAVIWKGYISSTANTVVVEVCVDIAATPTASTYNVAVQ